MGDGQGDFDGQQVSVGSIDVVPGVSQAPSHAARVCNDLGRLTACGEDKCTKEQRTCWMPEPMAAHVAATVLCPGMTCYIVSRFARRLSRRRAWLKRDQISIAALETTCAAGAQQQGIPRCAMRYALLHSDKAPPPPVRSATADRYGKGERPHRNMAVHSGWHRGLDGPWAFGPGNWACGRGPPVRRAELRRSDCTPLCLHPWTVPSYTVDYL